MMIELLASTTTPFLNPDKPAAVVVAGMFLFIIIWCATVAFIRKMFKK